MRSASYNLGKSIQPPIAEQEIMRTRTIGLSIVSVALLAAAAAAQQRSPDATDNQPPAGIGRLWNLTPEPITYELARNTGRPWSIPRTIQPGKFHELRTPPPGQRSPLLGINQRDRFVGVRFPALGGVVTVRLPGRNAEGELVPNWFFVNDANEIPRLIQASSPEEARQQYEQLKKSRPLTPENIERFKATLRANHVFADGR
jgi:hypothetical protein